METDETLDSATPHLALKQELNTDCATGGDSPDEGACVSSAGGPPSLSSSVSSGPAATTSASSAPTSGAVPADPGSGAVDPEGADGDNGEENTDYSFSSVQKCIFCSSPLSLSEGSKILECLHAICSACLLNWQEEVTAALAAPSTAGSSGTKKLCPVCQVASHWERLIENKFLLEVGVLSSGAEGHGTVGGGQGGLSASGEESGADIKCSNCPDIQATDWCDNCRDYICETCTTAHKQLACTKDHIIRPKDEVYIKKQRWGTENYPCPSHPKELLLLYCMSCNQMTCRDCQLSTFHREHKYSYLNEIADDAKKEMANLLGEIQYKSEILNAAISILDERGKKIIEKKSELLKEIKEIVTKLTEHVSRTGKELMFAANEACSTKLETHKQHRRVLVNVAAQAAHCADFVKKALTNSSNNCLLYGKQLMLAHLNRIKTQRSQIPNPEFPINITLVTANMESLVKVMTSFAVLKVDGHGYPPKQGQQLQPQQQHQQQTLQQMNLVTPPPPYSQSNLVNTGGHQGQVVQPSLPQNTAVHPQQHPQLQTGYNHLHHQPQQQQKMQHVAQIQQQHHVQQQQPQQQIQKSLHHLQQMYYNQQRYHGGGMQPQQQPMRQQPQVSSSTHPPPPRQNSPVTMYPQHHHQQQQPQQQGSYGQSYKGGGAVADMDAMMRGRRQLMPGHNPVQRQHSAPYVNPALQQQVPNHRMIRNMQLKQQQQQQQQCQQPQQQQQVLAQQQAQPHPPAAQSHLIRQLTSGGTSVTRVSAGSSGISWHIPQAEPAESNRATHQQFPQPAQAALQLQHHAPPLIQHQPLVVQNQASVQSVSHQQPPLPPPMPSSSVQHQQGDSSFKILLTKSVTPPTARTPTAVTSSVPKTPSPGAHQARPEDTVDIIDKFCRDSLNEVMMTLVDLDRRGTNGMTSSAAPSPAGSSASSSLSRSLVETTADLVHSSTGSATAPTAPPGMINHSRSSDGVTEPVAGTAAGGNPNQAQPQQQESNNDDPNDDWCAVCMDGGDLVCCDNCPKVFHVGCHIPSLVNIPDDSWQCMLCQNLPCLQSAGTNSRSVGGQQKPSSSSSSGSAGKGLTEDEQRVCERILLELYCQYDISLPFRAPVPQENVEYFKKVRNPMSLDEVRARLSWRTPLSERYTSVRQVIKDIRQVFTNAFNYFEISSKEYIDGMALEEFLESQLLKYLPRFAHTDLHQVPSPPPPNEDEDKGNVSATSEDYDDDEVLAPPPGKRPRRIVD